MSSETGFCIYKYSRATNEKEKGDDCGTKIKSGLYCSKHKKLMEKKKQTDESPRETIDDSNYVEKLIKVPDSESRMENNIPEYLMAEELDEHGKNISINFGMDRDSQIARLTLLKKINPTGFQILFPPKETPVEKPPIPQSPTESPSKAYFNAARTTGLTARDVARIGAFQTAGFVEKQFSLENYQKTLFNDPDFNDNFNQFLEECVSDKRLLGPGQSAIAIAGVHFFSCSTEKTPIVGQFKRKQDDLIHKYRETAAPAPPPPEKKQKTVDFSDDSNDSDYSSDQNDDGGSDISEYDLRGLIDSESEI